MSQSDKGAKFTPLVASIRRRDHGDRGARQRGQERHGRFVDVTGALDGREAGERLAAGEVAGRARRAEP